MFHLLVFLLSLCQLSPVTFSETIDTSKFSINSLNNDDYNKNNPESQTEISLLEALDYPIIKPNNDETEMDFNDLNSAINMLKYQQQKQQAMNMNNNFMRFGKRQMESLPTAQALESFEPGTRFERSNGAEGVRDSRRDSFIRFGRSGSGSQFMRLGRTPSDFMRFGRTPSDFMRFGRASSDFMRFGRDPSNFMRLGRNPSDFLRFGRSAPSDFMRFGRSPSDFMRLGRTPSDFMRFGRTPSDFMRFGRTPSDFMRFGRTPSDFMRFGRNPSSASFMRLGRSQNGMIRSSNKLVTSPVDKNFMRSGRPDSFMRFGRASSNDLQTNPNFMRFGKRQKNETSQNQTNKPVTSEESTTSFPYHELESEVDPIDLLFLNDLTDSDDSK